MSGSLRIVLSLAIALAVAGAGGETRAHDHLPPGAPGAGSHSPNMHFLATLGPSGSVNSDLAFQGSLVYAGNFGGFRVIDVSDPEAPQTIAAVSCPGGQNDISVYRNVLILSVDTVKTGPECSAPTASPQTLETGWEGIRIFDVSDPRAPRYLTSVYTDCGSHTHTVVPQPERARLLVYVASYPLRSGPDCGPHDDPTDEHDPLHRKISIVEVPLLSPASAHLLSTPAIDVPTWNLLPAPAFNPMQGCHDFQVDLENDLAAAACSSVGQLWDISDPANPRSLDPLWEVDEPQVQFYHSALFSEDGGTTLFGDEIIFGSCDDRTGSGQIWFHSTATGGRLGTFQIPRAQPSQYCSAHMFNNIPGVAGDVLVSAWYSGGTTVVDYTDRANAREVGYYDPAGGSAWSSYWYNGFIYTNDIPLGVDVVLLSDKVRAGATRLPYLNPQTQERLFP